MGGTGRTQWWIFKTWQFKNLLEGPHSRILLNELKLRVPRYAFNFMKHA
jgi:hypothetical protein